MRTYRDPSVEKDKKKRRAEVAERFRQRNISTPLSCSVCGREGPLHVVKLSHSIVHFCPVDFREFSDRVSFLVKGMRDEGIQHSDQDEFPERLAEGLRQPEE